MNNDYKILKRKISSLKKQLLLLECEKLNCIHEVIEKCIKLHCTKSGATYKNSNPFNFLIKEKPIYINEESGLDIHIDVEKYSSNKYRICISFFGYQPYKFWEKTPKNLMKYIETDIPLEYIENKINKVFKKIENHMRSRVLRKEYQECKLRITE